MQFSSQHFYENKLVADETVHSSVLSDTSRVDATDITSKALMLIDTSGCAMRDQRRSPFGRNPHRSTRSSDLRLTKSQFRKNWYRGKSKAHSHAHNQGEGHPKFNLYDPGVRSANGFIALPEVYFSGSENVQEFLEGTDNLIRLLEIPIDLSCAYLKGHLLGRAQDWYQIFGSASVQNTTTDFAQLKAALSKAFPVIRNKKELEIKFYASQQRRDQEPTDFAYDLLKLNKKLELGMSEEALVDHIFVRLEPQVMWGFEIQKTRFNCWRSYQSLKKDIHER
ncbi:uncharacterized protein TNCV_3421111 [Trichonephila clavipes]|nr:uncharacterized protein TNCV_3421111 [Trichonephila clavipes]